MTAIVYRAIGLYTNMFWNLIVL